jgi:hypothetical protein
MKILYLLPFLGLLACATQKPAESHVNFKDCAQLYYHILEIKIGDSVDLYGVMTPKQHQQALESLDTEYRQRNTTDNFLRYCYQHMSPQQVSCSMSSVTMDGIDNCKF